MLGIFKYNPPEDNKFDLTFGVAERATPQSESVVIPVSANIDENYNRMKTILHTDRNGDILIKWFETEIAGEHRRGFAMFADGLVNGIALNDFVIRPIMSSVLPSPPPPDMETLCEKAVVQAQIKFLPTITELAKWVNIGNAAVFIDGYADGITADVKTWEHRGVDSPANETVVQGPHEGFNEVLRCNSALVRKSLNNPDLVMETVFMGEESRIPASLAYIDGVINPELLNEIRSRLRNIKEDHVLSIFDVEKQLEKRSFFNVPLITETERPDKVSRALLEGRAALIMNGSSHALILPSNITDIISSPEDAYLRQPYSVFIKIVRIIAMFLSLFTPGIFLAVTVHHPDAILTDMLIALQSARGSVPFSPFTEIILMEISFEGTRCHWVNTRYCGRFDFGTGGSFCRTCKSYCNYCGFGVRNSVFCHSFVFFGIFVQNNAFCVYCLWRSCRTARDCRCLVFAIGSSSWYRIFWCAGVRSVFACGIEAPVPPKSVQIPCYC